MDVKKISWPKCKRGQSIFEFVVFVPIMLGLISIFISVTGAINASINQQKAVRSYFYFISKGNSKIPSNFDFKLIEGTAGKYNLFGFFALGYRDKEEAKKQFAPCYPIHNFGSSEKDNETCEDPDFNENLTSFIRVYTVYGICGATFRPDFDGKWYEPTFGGASAPGACAIKKN